jgi:hypothetical protein
VSWASERGLDAVGVTVGKGWPIWLLLKGWSMIEMTGNRQNKLYAALV